MCFFTSVNPSIVLASLIKSGNKNPALYNNLITIYSKTPSTLCHSLLLFNNLPFKPTPVSWTSIISAHSRASPSSCFSLFISMLRSQTLPNEGTISSLIRTFSSSSSSFCLQLHCLSLKLSISSFPFSGSALVHFYANSSLPDNARKVFDEITHRDEVCYGTAIIGLAQNDRPIEAISLFKMMLVNGVESNVYSVSGALRACACLASLEQTREVHGHAVLVGVNLDLVVGTALVDAYGKSGMVIDARRVFDQFEDDSNLVMWNAMLSALAQQGDVNATKGMFDEMTEARDLVTDEYTFLAVLTAYSNAGLVDETSHWLELMHSRYKVEPRIEHYTCLVGAMARVGQLEKAEKIACTMPFDVDAAVWRTLLSGSVVHRSVELAQRVAGRLVELDRRDESAYVMLANIYSSMGKKDKVAKILVEMRNRGVKKEKGKSWIEFKGEVHEFIMGDTHHRQSKEIYQKVRELAHEAERLGCVEVDEGVWYHSERLALV